MIIQHNIAALNSYKNLKTNKNKYSKNLERLSSGYKINRAGDDAAGLAISENLRALINGTRQAEKNTQDGIGLIHTAEGAMQEIHSMLQRSYKLSIASANGTYNEQERLDMQEELVELKAEIDRIANDTDFNGVKVLKGPNRPGMHATEGGTEIKLPEWVINSSDTTDEGYLSDIHQTVKAHQNGNRYNIRHGAATLDFGGIDAGENINDLVGTKFYSTCFTCDQRFVVQFVNDGLGNRKHVDEKDNIYTIDINGITTAEDLVKKIIEGADKGNPYDHFLNLEASSDGKKLIIYDDRSLDPSPTGSNSLYGWKDWHFPDFNVNHSNNPRGALFGYTTIIGGDSVPLPAADIYLQAGPSAAEIMEIDLPNIDLWNLGYNEIRIDDQARAAVSVGTLRLAIDFISQERGRMGAYENRLNHAYNALTTSEENLTVAESRIRDTDMAEEITAFTKNNILLHASQSMVAQANTSTQGILSLLQG